MFFQRLREQIEKNTDFNIQRIQKAYDLAKSIHGHQKRKTGEPFVVHPVEVASMLCEAGATEDMICVALLHDIIENKDQHDFSRDFLVKEFGEKVVKLIEILSKLKSWQTSYCRMQGNLTDLENGFTDYPEAVIVKMADRIHNLQTIHGFEKQKQKEYLKETEKFLMPIFKKAAQEVQKKEYQEIMNKLIKKLEFEFKLKKGRSMKEKINDKNSEEALQIIKYEGWNGIKHIYEEVLEEAIRTGEDILAFEKGDEAERIGDDFFAKYIEKRIKNNVKAYVITPDTLTDKIYKEEHEGEFTLVKLISDFSIATNINIVGNLVMTFTVNPTQGTLRRDKNEAETLKILFQKLWKNK